jgi:ribosomal protein S18 acetylase RimI-like enzyme
MKQGMPEIEVLVADESDYPEIKEGLQTAFQKGAEEGLGECKDPILPISDIDESIDCEGSIVYKAVSDGEIVGGAIVSVKEDEGRGDLLLLYVKVGQQGKGIGQAIWRHIEGSHPNISVWETNTPYFEKRNIHFYINCLGFHAVEFYSDHHKDPNFPDMMDDIGESFRFEKRVRKG